MTAAAEAKKERPVLKLLSGKLKRAEHERMVYRIKPDDGTEIEDIMRPEFWAHVGRVLRPFDLIEVVFNNGQRFLELVVMDAGPLWAKVAIKTDIDLASAKKEAGEVRDEVEANAQYRVEWKGGAKWCVIRASDNEIIERNLASKEEAGKYLDNYLKVMNT